MVQQARKPETTDDAPQPERLTMTYEEFQVWYDREAGRRGEWVDGEVIVVVAPKTIHLRISMFLASLVSMFARDRGLGEVLATPEMRLRDGRSYREPDLTFVSTENADRITTDGIRGPADLVVELVSDDSVRRDRKDKFDEYEAAGVREYWIVDPRPLRRSFTAYALTDEGYFEPLQPAPDGRIASTVLPGFSLHPSWLWEEPLADPRTRLDEITGSFDKA